MDWIKLLFFINLAVLNVYFVKANNSQKEKLLEEEKTKFNQKASNSTQDDKETLEESPSGVIRFESPVISREKSAFTNKKYKEKSSTEKDSNRGTENFEDLAKEANWHSPVLTFTEVPVGGYWQGVSQIIPHIDQTDFISPIPIIKSQSFINKPKMSSLQISYPPIGKLEGRHVHASREYPDDYNSQEGQGFPESENHPGRGHEVHTETDHDFGRFLPVDYKSKLEKEAEALIKQKRTQSTTTTTTTVKPLITTVSRQRAQSSYRKPISKSFFYKGNFDDAYPFSETEKNQDDQRYVYTSEEYPNQQSTYASKEPVTSVAVEPFAPRPPITSTEAYQQQYNYPIEHLPQHNHHNKDSHHISSHNDDDLNKSPPRENSYYRDKSHGNDYHKNSNYDARDRYYVDAHNEGSQHEDPSYKGQYNVNSSPKTTHYETQHVRDPHNSEPPHKHQQHRNFHHRNPSSGEFHHTGPPNTPAQYDSSAEKYSPTNPDTFQKSFSPPYSKETPHLPYQYNKPEEFHPHQNNDGKELMPPYNSNFNQPIHQTDPSPNEYHQPYSNMPSKPPVSYPDYSQHAKGLTLDQPSSGPLQKTPEEEKAYYNTVKSLVDLYKSFGLQPFNLDDVPDVLPPRLAFGNTFDGGKKVSAPTPNTGSSKDFIQNHKVQSYAENKNTPRDQNLNNYHKSYSNTNYKSQENEPNNARFKHSPSDRSKYFPHHEQNPYDSPREPPVSTEHFDSSESPRPDLMSTQGESPKEAYFGDGIDFKHHSDSQNNKFSHTGDEKIQGIRIKDYDQKTFFGDSQEKNYDSSQESDFISSVSHSDGSKHPHSIVRQNPYNIYPEEVRTTFRPRVYKQNIHVQITPSISDSVEKTNDFYSNEEISEFSPPNDAYDSPHTISNGPRNNRHFNPVANHNEHSQNAYNNPRSNILQKQNEHWRPQRERKYKYRFEQDENDRYHGHRENRQNRRKKTAHNHNRKKPSDFRQTEQRSKSYKDSDVQQKRHGKRQRHPRNLKPRKKSHGDYMRAESSAYHWGMEKHKEKDGFFQYANVPGAKAFEYGYRMGGPDQTQERHHQTKGIKSKIKVNWEDKNGDSGDHYWEFNHNSDEAEEDTEEKNSKSEEYLKEESEELTEMNN